VTLRSNNFHSFLSSLAAAKLKRWNEIWIWHSFVLRSSFSIVAPNNWVRGTKWRENDLLSHPNIKLYRDIFFKMKYVKEIKKNIL
jgi:hypothetical protein